MGFEALMAVNIKIPISSQQMMMQVAGCSKHCYLFILCHIPESEVFIENQVSMKAELKIKLYQQ